MARLTQTGDTIVEVLIAIAIISLVLVGAYVSTNKNIAQTQDAQERSQAVKLAETQVELIRSYGGTAAVGNCLSKLTSSALPDKHVAGATPDGDPCVVDGSDTLAASGIEPAYTLDIGPGASSGTYAVNITWDAVTGIGQDKVTMYYAQP